MRNLEQAKELLRNGQAQEALLMLQQYADTSSSEYKYLKEACKKTLAEQYIYLINEAINEKNMSEAQNIANRYLAILGSDEQINKLVSRLDVLINQGSLSFSTDILEKEIPPIDNNENIKLKKMIWGVALVPIAMFLINWIITSSMYINGGDLGISIKVASYIAPINIIVNFLFLWMLVNKLTESRDHLRKARMATIGWGVLSMIMVIFQWINLGTIGEISYYTMNYMLNDYFQLNLLFSFILSVIVLGILNFLRVSGYSIYKESMKIGMISSIFQAIVGAIAYIFEIPYLGVSFVEFGSIFLGVLSIVGVVLWYIFLLKLYQITKSLINK